MKILLVNVDSKFNLAIRRMYNYFKDNNEVEMIDLKLDGYPNRKKKIVDGTSYDKVYSSNIFEINQDRFEIIGCNNIIYGGIGSVDPNLKLPVEIENTEPFYYPEEDTSYGFITRGCIRNCFFCKVPKYEGKLKVYNSLESIIKHKKVKFLDNNILAYDKHMEVFKYLIENNIRCEFNQGLDFRLINEDNAKLLSELNYMGEYIFAFDNPKYQPLLEMQLKIIKKYIPKDWKVKFYIYQNKDMDIGLLIKRVEWCRKNKCLPYFMRDINCWDSKEKNFYIDYAAYCNQPSFFKCMDFETFLYKRHKKIKRIKESLKIYNDNLVCKYAI
ncbi:hypothetical protein [Clostridium botulinum]|uniref:hypothetical protein n=1 Tax=Clostridium botulinum TaxID=1491 RepID=UPI0007733BED|nr:hypothetical protein [Clostridium botulinum]AUM92697.1 hypothetical protein RSJ5_15950 [Clostridium botulinum]NFB12072.1 hypothetical protein [Clostridium botulinum]NFH59576.1 hypothetical protein [Clostridium botulinum]NFJ87159.1 hypothetical protein [Clostridium botulinum]NFS06283.1 hypothetical protein [Clostridium botulinum]